MTGEVGPPHIVGQTPIGRRLIVPVLGGHFEGPKLRGRILPGGADWLLVLSDGSLRLDVRITLETTDGHVIAMKYKGVRRASSEIAERFAIGEPVDPSEYYFRCAPLFEAGPGPYEWLNGIVTIAVGARVPSALDYEIFEVA